MPFPRFLGGAMFGLGGCKARFPIGRRLHKAAIDQRRHVNFDRVFLLRHGAGSFSILSGGSVRVIHRPHLEAFNLGRVAIAVFLFVLDRAAAWISQIVHEATAAAPLRRRDAPLFATDPDGKAAAFGGFAKFDIFRGKSHASPLIFTGIRTFKRSVAAFHVPNSLAPASLPTKPSS